MPGPRASPLIGGYSAQSPFGTSAAMVNVHSQAVQGAMVSLQNKVQELSAENVRYETGEADLRKELQGSREELALAHRELEAVKRNLQASEQNTFDKTQQLENLREELQTLTMRHTKATEAALTERRSLEDASRELSMHYQAKQTKLLEVQAERDAHASEREHLQQQLSQLKETGIDLRNERFRLQEKAAAMEAQSRGMEQLAETKHLLEKEIVEVKLRNARLEEQVEEVSRRNFLTKDRDERILRATEEITSEKQDLACERDRLRSENSSLLQMRDAAEARAQALQESLWRCETNLAEASANKARLEEELRKAQVGLQKSVERLDKGLNHNMEKMEEVYGQKSELQCSAFESQASALADRYMIGVEMAGDKADMLAHRLVKLEGMVQLAVSQLGERGHSPSAEYQRSPMGFRPETPGSDAMLDRDSAPDQALRNLLSLNDKLLQRLNEPVPVVSPTPLTPNAGSSELYDTLVTQMGDSEMLLERLASRLRPRRKGQAIKGADLEPAASRPSLAAGPRPTSAPVSRPVERGHRASPAPSKAAGGVSRTQIKIPTSASIPPRTPTKTPIKTPSKWKQVAKEVKQKRSNTGAHK
ncbi:hypothetical protein CYMTET_51546 [Cymbomonas tetramitiformis]|uniref:Uncharacterized protein n=1 Tax=Cymbomonas tetramitiformis TaxID=36881 RepID=A0AAE0BKU3_9CHLO|nr:hypothetical protein CYMTET_51546 [Cymbomonas tetramitiformis]